MYEVFALTALLVGTFGFSKVTDREHQYGVHISDYCPESPHCVEGSHVMCVYYNPDKPMGPRCYDPQNVTMDTVLADKLLKLLNAVRAKIALGKEKGMNGELLPRAYGMMKLGWDSELATFAQVLANQCLMMHDLCRATSRFTSPGQIIGSCRFTHPNWTPISHIHYQSTNLTQEKLLHAMTAIVKSWYARKDYVTPNTVLQYPDWSKTSSLPKLYLEMIYGHLTHIGCGVSASTTYSYSTRADVILNMVIVVCNLSSRPSHTKPVYTVEPPTEVGYTVRCGCPPGYDEDENCLCSESDTRLKLSDKVDGCFLKRCQPNMILLPIFTVENAPPEKLIPLKYNSDFETLDSYTPVVNDSYLENLNQYQRHRNRQNALSNVVINEQKRIGYKKTTIRPILSNVQNRFLDKKANVPRPSFLSNSAHALGYTPAKKTSIFSKVPVFDLSKKGDNSYKHNVQPRKDFTNAKNLVKNYMNFRRNQFESRLGSSGSNYFRNQPMLKTETYLTSAEEKIMNFNYFQQNKIKPNISEPVIISSDDFTDLESSHERPDDNLMHLLNKLEQEVRHTELNGVKREIFDAKIRKIYDAVIGDSVDLFSKRYTDAEDTDFIENEATDLETDRNKYNDYENMNHKTRQLHNKATEFSENKNKIDSDYHKKKFDIQREGRPIGKSLNSLMHEELDEEYLRNLNTKYDAKKHNHKLDMRREYSKDIFRKNEAINPRNELIEKAGKLRDIYSEDDERNGNDAIENRPLNHDKYDNQLVSERRKYYQTKLDNLERKLRESKKHHKDNIDRPSLPVRLKTREEAPLRPVKTQLDPFYVADRARFLNGF